MIRTRFAPSPTGYLHIGGVRTALFNWLFARRHAGRFVLRIDDTDAERNVDDALAPILHGFRWLGIDWDEGAEVGGEYGPYYQSQRQELYRSAAARLVERGMAYWDFAKPEEMQVERESAERDRRPFVYSRRWSAESREQRAAFEREGRLGVIRLKMPRQGVCRFVDLIRGEMQFEWAREQDHVIQRANGSCLYHLASVVDDFEMRISHVIRAEEHLSNTPRQIFIAQGLGYELPRYAHLPYVAEPGTKNKLSKRKLDKYLKNPDFAGLNDHGRAIAKAIGLRSTAETFNPVIVDFYERVGFLPDAVLNYLLLLGWSLDDKTEIFGRREMIEAFSLERVNKAPASFDPKKLLAFQERYMQRQSIESRIEMVLPYLQRAGLVAEPVSAQKRSMTELVVAAAGDRIKVAGDVLAFDDFFVDDAALLYDEAAFDKRLRRPEQAAELLLGYRARLAEAEAFDAASLERSLGAFVEERGIKLSQIIHALRVAVTGKGVGFGLFEALSILGKDRSLRRIDRALALLQES